MLYKFPLIGRQGRRPPSRSRILSFGCESIPPSSDWTSSDNSPRVLLLQSLPAQDSNLNHDLSISIHWPRQPTPSAGVPKRSAPAEPPQIPGPNLPFLPHPFLLNGHPWTHTRQATAPHHLRQLTKNHRPLSPNKSPLRTKKLCRQVQLLLGAPLTKVPSSNRCGITVRISRSHRVEPLGLLPRSQTPVVYVEHPDVVRPQAILPS
jgi:hypothetical protein